MLGWFGLGSGTGLRTMWSGFGGVAAKAGKGVWSKPSNSGLAVGGTAARGGAEVVGCVPARVFRYHSRPRGPSGGGTEAGAGEGRVGLSAPGLVSAGFSSIGLASADAGTSKSFRRGIASIDDDSRDACVPDSITNCAPGAEEEGKNSPGRSGLSLCCPALSCPAWPGPAWRRQPSRLLTNPQRPRLLPLAAWLSPIPASPAADRGPSLKHL